MWGPKIYVCSTLLRKHVFTCKPTFIRNGNFCSLRLYFVAGEPFSFSRLANASDLEICSKLHYELY